MSITKLPEKMRKATWETPYSCDEFLLTFADELEAVLPKWTQMTDDESTWPVESLTYMMNFNNGPMSTMCSGIVGRKCFEDGNIVKYRRWCDLDFPPEESE